MPKLEHATENPSLTIPRMTISVDEPLERARKRRRRNPPGCPYTNPHFTSPTRD